LEREHDRSGIRLIDGRIARSDDTAEERGPADPIRLATQQQTGFVADHPEKKALSEERSKQFAATRQRVQPLEMNCTKCVEIDLAGLLPSCAEMDREALAEAEPDAFLGLLQRP